MPGPSIHNTRAVDIATYTSGSSAPPRRSGVSKPQTKTSRTAQPDAGKIQEIVSPGVAEDRSKARSLRSVSTGQDTAIRADAAELLGVGPAARLRGGAGPTDNLKGLVHSLGKMVPSGSQLGYAASLKWSTAYRLLSRGQDDALLHTIFHVMDAPIPERGGQKVGDALIHDLKQLQRALNAGLPAGAAAQDVRNHLTLRAQVGPHLNAALKLLDTLKHEKAGLNRVDDAGQRQRSARLQAKLVFALATAGLVALPFFFGFFQKPKQYEYLSFWMTSSVKTLLLAIAKFKNHATTNADMISSSVFRNAVWDLPFILFAAVTFDPKLSKEAGPNAPSQFAKGVIVMAVVAFVIELASTFALENRTKLGAFASDHVFHRERQSFLRGGETLSQEGLEQLNDLARTTPAPAEPGARGPTSPAELQELTQNAIKSMVLINKLRAETKHAAGEPATMSGGERSAPVIMPNGTQAAGKGGRISNELDAALTELDKHGAEIERFMKLWIGAFHTESDLMEVLDAVSKEGAPTGGKVPYAVLMTAISAIQVANVVHPFFPQTAADFGAFAAFTIYTGWQAALDKRATTQQMQALFLALSSGSLIVAPPEIATLAGAKVYDGFDKNLWGATAAVLTAEVLFSDKVGPAVVSLPKLPGMIRDMLSNRGKPKDDSAGIDLGELEGGVAGTINTVMRLNEGAPIPRKDAERLLPQINKAIDELAGKGVDLAGHPVVRYRDDLAAFLAPRAPIVAAASNLTEAYAQMSGALFGHISPALDDVAGAAATFDGTASFIRQVAAGLARGAVTLTLGDAVFLRQQIDRTTVAGKLDGREGITEQDLDGLRAAVAAILDGGETPAAIGLASLGMVGGLLAERALAPEAQLTRPEAAFLNQQMEQATAAGTLDETSGPGALLRQAVNGKLSVPETDPAALPPDDSPLRVASSIVLGHKLHAFAEGFSRAGGDMTDAEATLTAARTFLADSIPDATESMRDAFLASVEGSVTAIRASGTAAAPDDTPGMTAFRHELETLASGGSVTA